MSDFKKIPRDRLTRFEFTQEIVDEFRKIGKIPVNFYNRDGQILIHRQDSASSEDFARLLKFELQGIYFYQGDARILAQIQTKEPVAKSSLLDREKTVRFAKLTESLITDLKNSTITSDHAVAAENYIHELLTDFTSNPEFESGIINVLEVLGVAGVSLESEMMTKRTVVAMGMKVRTKILVSNGDKATDKREHINTMMASYLLDVGYARLNVQESNQLSKEEYATIQQHPVVSYLMSLTAPEISTEVRSMILNHHRPYRGNGINNNYPDQRTIFNRLMTIRDKYVKQTGRERIVEDIQDQLRIVANNTFSTNMEDDIAILSLASEYSSLTSEQKWRPAFKSTTALKIILNDSFFSYSNKNIRHLLDYVGSSLANDQKIINPGDFVITASMDSKRSPHFDLCRVLSVDRYQTRPKLERLGTIKPLFQKGNKYRIHDFDRENIILDKRRARFDLAQTTETTRIIYLVDPDLNQNLYNAVWKLSATG